MKQIWSASTGAKHKPPTDLVMKSFDWGAGTNSITTLHNSEGDVSRAFPFYYLYSEPLSYAEDFVSFS